MDEMQAVGPKRSFVLTSILIVLVLLGFGGWIWCWRHLPVTACNTRDLSLAMSLTNGTAGTAYQDAVITNHGARTCTLTGYPTVVLLDSHGTQLGTAAVANTAYAPKTVTLHAGGKAHSDVGFPDVGNFDLGVCSATSTKLKVTLPGSTAILTTTLSQNSCPGFATTALRPGA